ncbi:MAG: sugar ABC transporter ATP-binding protein, partial [Rhodospirillaceae bacterium]|nr:sugar ABC transporter ATP-binding protein [Rhodospirillaceae bacterium]
MAMAVRQGEIHGIIGRNGAGKSVLVSMIAGVIRPTGGRIIVNGVAVDAASYDPVRAHELGVSLVPQEPRFAKRLSVVDNLFMGRPITDAFGLLRRRAMVEVLRDLAQQLGLEVAPSEAIGRLPMEVQQLLAFGKAQFIERARVILLDEITASLSRQRKSLLLSLLRRLVEREPDRSFTLISHHVAEIMEFCDRVTVMRDGRAVATLDVDCTSARELADWIVGDARVNTLPAKPTGHAAPSAGAPAFALRGLGRHGVFEGLDLDLRLGQVVGFAGLDGSGKDEAAEALLGLGGIDTGEVRADGRPLRIGSPGQAMAEGIVLLAKHREHQGVIPGRSVEENVLISSYRAVSSALGFVDRRQARRITVEKIAQMKIKAAGPWANMSSLSGGNKQKVLISRLSLVRPRLFILNEPTRGVDLATKPEILHAIRTELAATSAVIMLAESEDELVTVC